MKKPILSIVVAICGAFTGTAFAQTPINDDFANAHTISGGAGSVNGSNVSATMEPGEPDVINAGGTDYPLNSSVWYSWMAPRNGTVIFYTNGAGFLRAYIGTAVNTLTPVSEGNGVISFEATAGTVYRIQHSGVLGNESAFTLAWDLFNPNGNLSFSPSAVEVDETAGTVTLTVTRASGTDGTVGASYSTSPGSATAEADYTTTNGTVTFGPGVASKTFTVPILFDPAIESPETFTVALSGPTGGADLGTNAPATVEIVEKIPGDDFTQGIAITGATGTANATDDGATSQGNYEDGNEPVIWFAWTAPITGLVQFNVPDDTGHFVEIFRGTTYANKISIGGSANTTVATASVTAGSIYHLAVGGGSTDFTLSWQMTTHGLLSLAGTQRFFDSNLSVDRERFVADEKGGAMTVKVRRTGGLDGTVSVTVQATADANDLFAFTNATAGSDFTATAGTVTFQPGEAEKTFTIAIINDTEAGEATEDFVIKLLNPVGGAFLGTAVAQAHIFDDEGDPANDDIANAQPIFGPSGTVAGDNTLADVEATEPPFVIGSAGITDNLGATLWYRWTPPASGVAEFTALIEATAKMEIIDIYAAGAAGLQFVAHGGPDIDQDLEPVYRRAIFNAEAGQVYYVRLDGKNAPPPTLGVTALTWNLATGGIIKLGTQSFAVTEGQAAYQLLIQREGGLSNSASVTLSTSDGSATEFEDYTPVNTTVVFNPGEATKTVSIPILDDPENEGDETFDITLYANGGILANSGPVSVTIFDDEDDPANDLFITRTALAASGTEPGTTKGASFAESGEPDHGGFSVWYRWTSPIGTPGVATFDLGGESEMSRPTVTVYTGTAVNGLALVVQGSDQVSFITTPNTTYAIAITDRGTDDGAGGLIFSPSTFNLEYGFNATGSVISFTNASLSVAETASTLTVSLTRSGSTTDTASVDFALEGGSAIAGDDYTSATDTIIFDVGETTKTFTIDLLNDTVFEGDETFFVSLSEVAGAVLVSSDPLKATVTILDDDAIVLPPIENDNFADAVLLAGNYPVVTGFTAGATVEANEPTVAGVAANRSVWYQWVAPGDGVARLLLNSPTHFTSAYTGITLANLAEVTFVTPGTFAVTSGTTYFVPVNASAGDTFDLTINFTAAGLFILDPNTLAVSENNGPAAVTILRSNGTAGAASVRFRAVSLTAQGGSDFTAMDTIVNFASGVGSQIVNVPITDDALEEGPETVRLILSDPTGGAITAYGPDQIVTLLIQDDESSPANDNLVAATAVSGPFGTTFGSNVDGSVEAGEPTHADVGTGASIWFRWTAPANGPVTFQTTGSEIPTVLAAYTGTSAAALTPLASNASDPSTITFAATGGTSYAIAVDSSGAAQGDITLSWNLLAPGALGFSPSTYAVAEGAANIVLTVARAAGTSGSVTVHFATADGSAIAGQDYAATSGDLTFGNGETTKTIPVPLLNDAAFDAGESFSVVLSAPTNGATLGLPTAAVTINDDEANPLDSFANAVALTGPLGTTGGTNAGATSQTGEPTHAGTGAGASIWFRWTAPANGTVTFQTTSSAIPTALAAYTGTAVNALTSVASNAGNPSTISFAAIGGASYAIAVDSTSAARGSITLSWNLLVPGVLGFSPSSYAAVESAASVVLTVARSTGWDDSVTVHFTTADGSATAGQDYTTTAGDLTFANGETTKTITVPVLNDTVFETGESFAVVLSAPTNGAALGATTATVALTSNDPFVPAMVKFAALVNSGGTHATSGFLNLTLSANAAFSGKVLIGGKPTMFTGAFDSFGAAIVSVARKGLPTLSIALQIGEGGEGITGRVYNGTFDSPLSGEASFFDKKVNLYPKPGAYTLACEPTAVGAAIPQGFGTATMTVTTAGVFTIKGGQLGDAFKLDATGFIAKSGKVQFYALLYKGLGSISGVVTFRNETLTDADGTLAWFKPANVPKEKFFVAGFTTDVDFESSRYVAPAANSRMDNAFDANSGATTVVLSDGGLAAPGTLTGLLSAKNVFAVTAPAAFTLTGTSKTGAFGGSFTPAGGTKTPIRGVFLQKSNEAIGQFFGATLGGSIEVAPSGP